MLRIPPRTSRFVLRTKNVREFVCNRLRSRKFSPPSGDDSSISRFVLRESIRFRLEKDDCDCTRDEPIGIGFRASFSSQLSSSRNSLRFFANSSRLASLRLRARYIRPHAVWLSASKVFFLARKKFHRLARKIFSKRLNCRRAEEVTGLLYTIGHVQCLSKLPARWSTMQI